MMYTWKQHQINDQVAYNVDEQIKPFGGDALFNFGDGCLDYKAWAVVLGFLFINIPIFFQTVF